MSHTVAVGEFEGPLGVLLELVEHNKLEVSAISVAVITRQYLDKIHELAATTPEDLSDFLQLGARLLYIKSLALLPQADSAEQAAELQRLNVELAEYKTFQEAARGLATKAHTPTWPRSVTTKLAPRDLPLPNISLEQLAQAFSQALALMPIAAEPLIIKSHLNLDTAIKRLRERLTTGFELHTLIEASRDRLEVVVTFLALLELVRDGSARVTQSGQFDAIRVEPLHAR